MSSYPEHPLEDAKLDGGAGLPGDGPEPIVYPRELDEARIDPDAAKVVKRLVRHGHEAYLVGGCVRDLLVGRAPKDFDVATSARPDDVRALFKNSRIIGRRFRLVHVLFGGGKVIETATFRRAPEQGEADSGDILIRNDNVFGEAHQDATRRDFTMNGLFYDLERRVVLDWVGGLPDIERRTVHTIGTPSVRFREDPVRMLRAIKFCAKLDFGMSADVYDAMVACRTAVARAAKPRLFEELLRLLREGAAHRSFWLAWETGLLDVLLPELATYLADQPEEDDTFWRLLGEVDRATRERGAPLDDVVLIAALLMEPLREASSGARDRVEAAFRFLEPVVDRLNVPRRIVEPVRRVNAILPRLENGRAGRFARTSLYPVAHEVASLYAAAQGRELTDAPTPERSVSSAGASRRKRRRRRPRAEA